MVRRDIRGLEMTGMRGLVRGFMEDESGVALILITIMLPVIIGFSLLAIDMSRVNNLHNDEQKGADAFALAAAAELDGNPDAITRADRAIDNLLANTTDFSTLGHYTLSRNDLTVTYLTGIPASDATPLSAAGVGGGHDYSTTNPALAKFAEVTVNPTNFSTIFPASFLGGSNDLTVGTQAVAGYGSAVCDFTPLFICNPYEGDGHTLQEIVQDVGLRRRMIEMKKKGGNTAQYFPGDYGLLQTPSGANGTPAILDMIAKAKPETCYSSNGVSTRPGNPTPTEDAFNVRFDMYNQQMKNNKGDPNYKPGQVVIKGYEPKNGKPGANSCNMVPDTTSGTREALPHDTCLDANNCAATGTANMDGRVGDGYWDVEGYWAVNHPSASIPNGWSNASPPSRYEVYQYEVAHRTDAGFWGVEDYAPGCYTGGDLSSGPDRRLLYGAILDCNALAAEGYKMSGQSDGLPVKAFGSFFMTQPVGSDSVLYVELVDITGVFGNGTLTNFSRDESQLYR